MIWCKWWLIIVVMVNVVTAWIRWHYPFLPVHLLTPSSSDGHGLRVRDDSDGCDGSRLIAWDQGCRPGPPRIIPLVHNLLSPLSILAGHSATVSPECLWFDRRMVGPGSLRKRLVRRRQSWCRWREGFKEGHVKGGVNSVPGW